MSVIDPDDFAPNVPGYAGRDFKDLSGLLVFLALEDVVTKGLRA